MLGYLSFPFILIGTISGLAYARIASDRSADLVFNANESTKMPRLLTFVLLNLLAATVFILVILQKILFCDPNSISGNPNISLYSLWPSPFFLFSGYTEIVRVLFYSVCLSTGKSAPNVVVSCIPAFTTTIPFQVHQGCPSAFLSSPVQ